MVEGARKRRLLEDSDSQGDAAAAATAPPQPALLPNPAAILEEAPKANRKVESWESGGGTLGSRPQLSGLVVVKETDLDRSTPQGRPAPTLGAMKNGKGADPAPRRPGTSSLSQLGAHPDSEDSSSSGN